MREIKRMLMALCLVGMFAVSSVGAFSRAIVNDKVTVAAGKYVYYQFSVSSETEIKGRFRAEGGSGNDIEVYILDSDGFENWRNGHTANTWYNSGRVTVANISVRVPRGEYFLIFNNNFSMFSNKVVSTTVQAD